MPNNIIIRHLGTQDYLTCWEKMRAFTNQRTKQTPDEIWLLEHPHVFTQGQNGKPEHILTTTSIPIVASDRGGQVTYHGPGQLIAYILVDLERRKYNIRQLVTLIEDSVINLLASYHISASAKREAPGIYINQEKICSIGLRIRRGCSYHGLALNIDMDLTPFTYINPCGFPTLKMTQLSTFLNPIDFKLISTQLAQQLIDKLNSNTFS
jgi:lipoyl(octanoyl) transferase